MKETQIMKNRNNPACNAVALRAGIITTTILLALGLLALSPIAQAVTPAPDGSYAGGNTAEGQAALFSLTSGTYNTAVGFDSLRSNTTGALSTAIGAGTLLANTASENTATGAGALLSNTTGTENTANGAFALFFNTGGAFNTASGTFALESNATGENNTAVGDAALLSNTAGVNNTAVGSSALYGDTGGSNTAIGAGAGSNLTTGDNNIDIGYNVVGVAAESNTIRIGSQGVQTRTFIAGIWDHLPIINSLAVQVASNGQLSPVSSSRRFKRDIEPMRDASAAILALTPVTFHYKSDAKNTPCFGLIADEVEKVNPDLVVRDKEGKPYGVRYDQVNAMLLNEFLKEHRKVVELASSVTKQETTIAQQARKIQEQEAMITQLNKGMETVVAQVKQQSAQIQKVSARLETSQPKPHLAANRD